MLEPVRCRPALSFCSQELRAAGAGAGSRGVTGAGRSAGTGARAGAGRDAAEGDSAAGPSCGPSGAGSGAGDDEKSLRRRKLNMRAGAG